MKRTGIIYCNCCGRPICAEEEQKKTSYLAIKKEWGYFSDGKDGTVHSIDICEPCYDSAVRKLAIAPQIDKVKEFV